MMSNEVSISSEQKNGRGSSIPISGSLETRTLEIGKEIFRRVREIESKWGILNPHQFERIFLSPFVHDKEFRYRMLRFVDVYPALHEPGDVAHHLGEYLTSRSLALRNGGGRMLSLARGVGARGGLAARPLAWASRLAIRSVARRFIAGESPLAIAPRLKSLERDGFRFTLDLLGEFVASEAQADDFQKRYSEIVERLPELLAPSRAASADSQPRVNLSIKLSSLTSRFDPIDWEGTAASVLARLRPILRAARSTGAFINVDMEKFEYRDLTLEILKRLLMEDEFRGFANVGTVAQAYLADAEPALETLLSWLRERRQPLTIRLVKGAYWDSEQIWASQHGWPAPVLMDKRATDAQYERMTRRLLENHDLVRTAVGSHNIRSLAHALALKEELGVPADRFEIQMLFGMSGPTGRALVEMGLPVRIYVPCGELVTGMAYLVRRILENTANESFLRQRFIEHADEDRLLADPKEASHVAN